MTPQGKRPYRAALGAAAALSLSMPAAAQDAGQNGARDGAALAAACFSCHGAAGQGSGAIPALAGRPQDELLALMQAFRAEGAAGTIMPRFMSGYSEDEIAALAAWLSQQGE